MIFGLKVKTVKVSGYKSHLIVCAILFTTILGLLIIPQHAFASHSINIVNSPILFNDGGVSVGSVTIQVIDPDVGTLEALITSLSTPIIKYEKPISLGKKEFSIVLPSVSGKDL